MIDLLYFGIVPKLLDSKCAMQWFSTFHGLWPRSPFIWRIINIVTLGFCNITAELISKSLCSWPARAAEVSV